MVCHVETLVVAGHADQMIAANRHDPNSQNADDRIFDFCVGSLEHSFFFSSRGRHTRSLCDWSSEVCSSDLRSLAARAASSSGISVPVPATEALAGFLAALGVSGTDIPLDEAARAARYRSVLTGRRLGSGGRRGGEGGRTRGAPVPLKKKTST